MKEGLERMLDLGIVLLEGHCSLGGGKSAGTDRACPSACW